MREILDKLILFLCCTALYLFRAESIYSVVTIIVTIVLTCYSSYFERKGIAIILYIIYIFISLLQPAALLYLPLMIYDHFIHKTYAAALLGFLPLFMHSEIIGADRIVVLIALAIVSFALSYNTMQIIFLEGEYYRLKDSARELTMFQEEKNRHLIENQDNEIHMAILNERNRISAEMHDSIGHLLSRSILQIGALLTIVKEDTIKEVLTELKTSISEGMDSIRVSIHNMHDESIDLKASIEKLVKNFTFCDLKLEYDILAEPALKVRYCLIATIKEALSNVIKHSDATQVVIVIKEHPVFYQLIIHDNGNKGYAGNLGSQYFKKEGIGLTNISERVKGFSGNINITDDNGFRIFITIPKENKS